MMPFKQKLTFFKEATNNRVRRDGNALTEYLVIGGTQLSASDTNNTISDEVLSVDVFTFDIFHTRECDQITVDDVVKINDGDQTFRVQSVTPFLPSAKNNIQVSLVRGK